jgi:RNA polymerase sigma factor (sigma-70 family)
MAPCEFDLQQCLRKVRQHDQEAARALVEALYPLVIRIVRGHLPVRSSEEDLTQEVFLKLFTKLDQYQERAGIGFEHWVSRLAVRTCLDALRAEGRRPELRMADLSEDQTKMLDFLVGNEAAPPDSAPGPVRELLEKVLSQLRPDDRLVIGLLDLEDRSVKEIAAITGWSVTLVKVRAFRARRKLRKIAESFKEMERT